MKSTITTEILNMVRTHAYKEDISISEFGRKTGISKAWLSKLKNTDANLSVGTAEKLLAAMGYKLNITKKKSAAININNISKEAKLHNNKIINKMLKYYGG